MNTHNKAVKSLTSLAGTPYSVAARRPLPRRYVSRLAKLTGLVISLGATLPAVASPIDCLDNEPADKLVSIKKYGCDGNYCVVRISAPLKYDDTYEFSRFTLLLGSPPQPDLVAYLWHEEKEADAILTMGGDMRMLKDYKIRAFYGNSKGCPIMSAVNIE